jgi:hypothetical protein
MRDSREMFKRCVDSTGLVLANVVHRCMWDFKSQDISTPESYRIVPSIHDRVHPSYLASLLPSLLPSLMKAVCNANEPVRAEFCDRTAPIQLPVTAVH